MGDASVTPRQLTATLVVCASNALETWRASWSDSLGRYLICDGTADDVEIQAAIDALPVGGGKVVLSEGTFNIASSIHCVSNLTVEGQSWGTELKATADLTGANGTGGIFDNNVVSAVSNILIKNLKFNSNNITERLLGFSINAHRTTHLKVEHCYFYNPTAYAQFGIVQINGDYITVTKNTFENVWILNVVDSNNILIEGNVGFGMYDSNLSSGTGGVLTYENYIIINNRFAKRTALDTGYNIEVAGDVRNVIIMGNTLNGAKYENIICHKEPGSTLAPSNVLINGNFCKGAGRVGIDTELSADVEVANNIVSDSIGYCIQTRGSGVQIQNNKIDASTQSGIAVYADSANLTNINIEGNYVSDGVYGIHLVQIGAYTLDSVQVMNNYLTGNTVNFEIFGTVTNYRVRNNFGYITENSGTAAVPKDGATATKDWPHGLAAIPTFVGIDPKEATGIDATLPQANIGATNFRIVLPAAQAASAAAVDGAIAHDDPANVDETIPANNANPNDMTLLPAAPADGDAYYIGATEMFCGVRINIGTAGVKAPGAWTINWEYYNGTAWVALAGVVDGTAEFTAAPGNHDVTFTIPTAWAQTTIATLARYWIRARASATTSPIGTQPLGTQAWVLEALHYFWRAAVGAGN